MTWWQKLFGNPVEENKREPVQAYLGMGYDVATGELDSPGFLDEIELEGFKWDSKRVWWFREWSTWTPTRMKKVLEIYQFNVNEKKWTYRIVKPEYLGGIGGGGNSRGWCIWESDEGIKE